ncbi:MAG: lytic transglycosylase domain-containing protein [Lutibacter sp.]
MNKLSSIVVLFFVIIISSLFIFGRKNQPVNDNEKSTSESYKIKALKIPEKLWFAGERVPLEKEDIKERIDRELLVNTYWQSNGLLMFKRTHKYFPIIEPILKRNGIPDDFKYLAVIESGLMNVGSPAGARGFWQLLKDTAKEKGLEVNNNVDERYNLELATQAACDYLKEARKKFGTWTLAAAAYNAGISSISKKLETQQVKSYYNLLVGDETKRYVPRIVAVKEILTHPKKYGFYFTKSDLYNLKPTKIIKVDTAITNIALFSKSFNINYKTLKLYNPWLRENKLNNKSRKLYLLKIPVQKQ